MSAPFTLVTHDEQKSIYSVMVTVCRHELISSGSMQFNHLRYLTFGQMVIFTDNDPGYIAGALVFPKGKEEEILSNIEEYIPKVKEEPESGALIKEVA